MYKLITIIFTLVLILSLTACGGMEAAQAVGTNGTIGRTASEAVLYLTGEIDGEITVSAYDPMEYKSFLEDAAKLFEEKYPGTTVNVETFSSMPDIKTYDQGGEKMVLAEYQDDPQGRQDYINQINTSLMSGGGADVLAIDVLPFYKYADSGQLENLAAYMQADTGFNKADYRANIFDALEYKNGIWFLPTDYSFDYYAYDSALLSGSAASGFGIDGKFTAEELVALAEPSFDGSAKIFNRSDYATGPRGDMWSLLLAESYPSFVDIESKKANFNDGSFAALLESVRHYSEQGYISKGAAKQTDVGEIMRRSKADETNRFFFKPQNAINLFSLYTRDLGMNMNSMAEGGTMAVGDNDEIAGIAAAADDSVPFTYSKAFGINFNSKNKDTAWAFLMFLLSAEMQLDTNLPLTAQPVLNSAREAKIELALTSMMQQGESLHEAQLEAIGEYSETIEKFSDQIDTYVIKDTVVDDMIAAEVKYFFEGTKTAAEVSEILQSKVDLYLNE